jgi:hypothetical protein
MSTSKKLGLIRPEEVNDHIDALFASLGMLFNITQSPLFAIAAAIAAHCKEAPDLADMLRRMLAGESVTSVYESVSIPADSVEGLAAIGGGTLAEC